MENVSLETLTAHPVTGADVLAHGAGVKPAEAPAAAQAAPTSPARELAEKLAGAPPETEAKASEEAPKEQDPQKEKDSARFAALARREASLVKQMQAFQAEKSKFETERQEFEVWKKAKAEEDALWEKNPFEALNRRNWSYDKLTNYALNDQKPTPEMIAQATAEQRIRDWEKAQEEKAKAAADAEAERLRQEHEKVTQAFRTEIQDFVSSHSEKYELINLYDAQGEMILATIEQHYRDTAEKGKPEVLGTDTAADLVEKYLESLIEKAHGTKKFQSKASPQPEGDKTTSKPAPTRTLNNNLTPSAPAPAKKTLSREERIKRAMALQV